MAGTTYTTGGDRAAFIRYYAPIAQRWAARTGIPADVYLALAASESNFGNTPGYALFGMLDVPGTAGTVTLRTETGGRAFAAYQSPDDAFAAFSTLVQRRYPQAWANRGNPAAFVQGLQTGGYAGNATANDRNWSNMIVGSMLPAVQAAARQQGVSLTAASAPTSVPAAAPAPAAPATSSSALPRGQNGWVLPVAGTITSLFGEPYPADAGRTYQGRSYAHFNAGIDIGGNVAGQTVVSMTPGRVVAAGPTSDGWGYVVRVQDPDGNVHNYGHVDAAQVQVGQQVQPGTPLARVWPGGARAGEQSTGPHLSYDIWNPRGEPVNPTPWLNQAGGAASAVHPAVVSNPQQDTRPSYLVQQRMSQGQYPSLPSTGTGGAAMSSPTQTQTPVSDSAIDTYMNSLADAINARQRDIAQLDARIASWDESKDGPRVGDVNPQTGTRTRTAYDNLVERRDTLASQQTQDVSAYQRTASAQGKARTPDDVSKLLAARADQVRANASVTSAGASVVDANARAGAVGVNIAELPFGAANAQANLGSASAALANANANAGRTSGDLLTALTNSIHTFAGDDIALGKYMDDIVSSAFTRAYNGALLQLKRGELSTVAFSNVVTAIAARTTAEAAWAMRSLAEAQYVSEENWKRAERLLPAGTQYMPGMGPNDERAQAMRKLGITPTVQQAMPLPADWNDPWANLRQADAQRQQLGQQRPGEAFAPAIAGQQAVAGDLYRDYQTPWTFTPPKGFETPLSVQPWPGRDQLVTDWTDEFRQWASAANYDTGMPGAPGYTAPPPVAGFDPEAFDEDGTLLTEEEKRRRRAAAANPPLPVPDLTPPPTPPVPTPGSNGAMARGGVVPAYSRGGRYGAPPVRPVFPVYGGYAA